MTLRKTLTSILANEYKISLFILAEMTLIELIYLFNKLNKIK